jgi:hypothetical protein
MCQDDVGFDPSDERVTGVHASLSIDNSSRSIYNTHTKMSLESGFFLNLPRLGSLAKLLNFNFRPKIITAASIVS